MTHTARRLLTDQMRRRLVSARKARGWSQADVARRMGCTQQLVSQLETGVKGNKLDIADSWCRALGLRLKVEIE